MAKKFKVDAEAKLADLGEGTSFASYSHIGEPLMARFVDRFIAYAIDSIILYLVLGSVSIIIFLIASFLLHLSYGPNIFRDFFNPLLDILVGFILVLDLIIGLVYYVYFYRSSGQTPGKMVMNIKVVDRSSLDNLSISKIIVRETIGRVVSLSFCYLGYFWYFYSEKRQTWHDNIVNSIVVGIDEEGEIIMKGKDVYTKNMVKTFLPPVLILITTIMAALMFIIVFQFLLDAGILYEILKLPTNIQQNSPYIRY